MSVLSTLNAQAQTVLPAWVRARALSYYLVVFMGGQAAGGVVWGAVANRAGTRNALLVAALLLALSAVAGRWAPLVDVTRLDPTPSTHWGPLPSLPVLADPDAGPVLVIVEYQVRPGEAEEFLAAMSVVARSRRRTGAHRWGLFRDPEDPNAFVESFKVATWAEHLRQHGGRLTVFDRRAEEAAYAHLANAPRVRHLLAADVPFAPSPAPASVTEGRGDAGSRSELDG